MPQFIEYEKLNVSLANLIDEANKLHHFTIENFT
jgi:hypothetical protein